jgi:hypothetical protein
MSKARPVLPEKTYMFTRRCTQKQFLMRPDEETNNAFIYCLAVAANRHGIEIVGTMAMSNHHHTEGRDPRAEYPAFLETFHKLFAKCQNALQGRWENFWSSEQTSVVSLEEPQDELDKLVYLLTNPVQHHLVEKAIDWPGASALQALLQGKPLTARRPKHFFRDDGSMPENVTLVLHRPKGYEHLSQAEFAQLLMERIEAVEVQARGERIATGRSVLGIKGVLRQPRNATPENPEPRRQINPRVAARSKWRRIEALARNKAFAEAYTAARKAFAQGLEVLFPDGTYWLRRFASVSCVGDVWCGLQPG